MSGFLDFIAALPPAEWLRVSRWGYAWANTAHVAGIALLFGSIAALDLRLIGAPSEIRRTFLRRAIVPVAAAGLAMALVTGLALFSVRPRAYADNPVFMIKLGAIFLGLANVAFAHLAARGRAHFRTTAIVSISSWLSALILGRMIAFTGE